ncbi:sensor histidine kinase [Novosphingobium nitrogenifigens]|uniref:sensor histidine kinase n=1 Tax=Novosphingobium nitrogenifigens TaxID=378548 RepID=UPI00200A17F0|nr:HAMP domain-containing sensor histidine kinase [Novosphingobium nitrogenifigens]
MISRTGDLSPFWRMGVPLAVLGASLLGLLVAFVFSLAAVSHGFEHALIAQQQAALVADIARDAETRNPEVLRQSLGAYRDLVAAEGRYLRPGDHTGQEREMRRASELAAMTAVPAERARLVTTVKAIAIDEAREVSAVRAELARVRRETVAFAALLAVVAMLTVVAGAISLARANRTLAIEVVARRAELDTVDRSRRLFFAKASHELRTPVTAIRVLAEVALESGGDAQGCLHDIVAQAGFLDHRIADMLSLAQAGEGRPSLVLVPGDLVGAIDAALAQAAAYARSIHVDFDWSPALAPAIVAFDQRWLAQAILTVIDNGLKYSGPGDRLQVVLTRDDGQARIAIADSGPGILPPDLPRIFDAYYQTEEGRARGGSGLGLALARWVLEQHGGAIHAENRAETEPGACGCRIVMTLPLLDTGSGTATAAA